MVSYEGSTQVQEYDAVTRGAQHLDEITKKDFYQISEEGSAPVIGIVILVVIIILVGGVVVIARAKGALCFAGKP